MNLLPGQVHDSCWKRKWYWSFLFFLLSCFFFGNINAQEKVITAGIQFKPIFSSKFFNTGPEETTTDNINFKISPGSGYCLGMVIRRGFTNTISMETGINYVKRNYDMSIVDADSSFQVDSDFGIVGYEIPLQGLVFIQLSDEIFMDVAMGFSFDFYPSDIATSGTNFVHSSVRNSWFSPSLIANLGWEYRTEKSGYIYLGASYHRPFSYTYLSIIQYQNREKPYPEGKMELNGNYLTFDIRYFFHSDPEKRKKKTRKPDPRTK
jgi:hypothetical protein